MKRLLVGIDGSSHAWAALDLAVIYAKALDAELLGVHVVPGKSAAELSGQVAEIVSGGNDDESGTWRDTAQFDDKIVTQTKRILEDGGVTAFKILIFVGDPAERIVYAANDHHVQLIFIGHRGLDAVEHSPMGSVANKVANMARCTCVIVK